MKLRNPLVKRSTLDFIAEARKTPGYSFFDFLHGYVYARWPYLYIGIGTGEHPAARWYARIARLFARFPIQHKHEHATDSGVSFADTYHGKVVPLDTAEQLVHLHDGFTVPDLEQVIPYKRARAIIMQNPDRIAVLDCPCRLSRSTPCQPLDVCLIVGEPFASFVREHHPDRSRWITAGEAVEIMRAEDERGHVHHAFFKDAMLGRFYAICNCCSCCCGAMQAHRSGTPMLASSGYVSQIDEELCIGCGDCNSYCQFEALELVEDKTRVIYEKCMGCGVCVSKCDQGAISLRRDETKGVPLEIRTLLPDSVPAPMLESIEI